ncbi:MAG TPA: phage holin family protein [Myxococcales bacterium]|nr:phage holin family protein [Myxococcales bacterium]
MARSDRRPPPAPPRDALGRLLDGVQTLFREHLALARIELKNDIRRTGRSVLLSAAGLPPLLVGYVLLMVAVALLLELVLVNWAAFGIVAVANLLGGAALTVAFTAKVRAEKLALVKTAEELRRDREWLSSIRHGNGQVGTAPRLGAPAPRTEPGEAGEPLTGPRARQRTQAMPPGKAGNADLAPRSPSPIPGQPVAGATSTPDGEPMTAQQH